MGIQIRWWSAGRQADRAVDKAFNDVFEFVMRALRDPDRAADVVLETIEIGGSYTFTVRATNAVGTGPAISLTKELLPCPG